MTATHQRQAHAVLDLPSRRQKAMKIERLLGLGQEGESIRLLEVGCGSGGISHYFASHQSGRFEVHAVDVKDSRVVRDGFAFHQVSGTGLPYYDDSFDVVISNHVIEHVGDAEAQLDHLREIRRVMKPGGIGYLAVPNRWMLIEPHYRLAFLSWLPFRWRSSYLRMFRPVEFYDCKPLEMRELEHMLLKSGFEYGNICVTGIRAMFAIEGRKGIIQRFINLLPDRILAWMNPINPTLIYKIR